MINAFLAAARVILKTSKGLVTENFPPATRRATAPSVRDRNGFVRCAILGTIALVTSARAADYPGAEWPRARYAEVGLSEARLQQARDYALTGGGSGVIIRRGQLVMEWGDTAKHYDLKSTAKSIGVTALGLALKDGK